ncbi:MAG: 2-oxoglutarate dehydrogenase E1 component [Deltaproteobacteria bacterium]
MADPQETSAEEDEPGPLAPEFLAAVDPAWLDDLAERYAENPHSVDPSWRAFFAGIEIGRSEATPSPNGGTTPSPGARPRTFGLVSGYRELGHLLADIDPLSEPPTWHPLLDIGHFSFSPDDLDSPVAAGDFLGPTPPTLRKLVDALKATYCGTMGVEYTGIRDPEQRRWLQERMEPGRNRPELDRAIRLRIYRKLVEAESLERFLQVKFPGQKRFSLEGGETTIPLLQAIVERCAEEEVQQLVLGMAHRGRLNVLANIVHKPFEMLLAEFEGSTLPDSVDGDGDVKYHAGYSRDHHAANGRTIHISLTPNPSHLEAVNPVVEGKVRAKQNQLGDTRRNQVVPVLLHGDAAFIGQGVVPETLLLTHLKGYYTGGTIHVVINNQIGFTTSPEASRPTRYPTDIARIIESPVFHVNGDDPEMAVHAARLAVDFRQRFGRDVIIELVCFRKHGHNELDEPSFTQPRMYQSIAEHIGTRTLYEKKLLASGEFSEDDLQAVRSEIQETLERALEHARSFQPRQEVFSFGAEWSGFGPAPTDRSADTALPAATLQEIATRAAIVPTNFAPHTKVIKVYEQRLDAVQQGRGIDFGCAEMLAFGSLLREGTPVRLSGQDSGRGTFSHRHSVLHDQATDGLHIPLNAVAEDGQEQARFEVLDSPLSEAAVLGFEYGYSSAEPQTLTIWEAQFGDFANGAQIIIDCFLAGGESRWQRSNGLVLFLPHGYEGQGAEHSSARLERWLQLCGDDNLQVVQPTTPAQLFHLLRRQMRRAFRKPLVVLTPKSLLRFKPAASALSELTEGSFAPVLPDPVTLDADIVTSVVLCTGRVFYDLAKAREARSAEEVVLLRIEEMHPFPAEEVRKALAAWPNAKDVIWAQEEPTNMGAWWYMQQHLPAVLGRHQQLRCAARDAAAAPAVGSHLLHGREQKEIMSEVFDRAPQHADTAATKPAARKESGGQP